MEIEFIKVNNELINELDPNWGDINFIDNNELVINIKGDIIKLLDFLIENENSIRKDYFFYGNEKDSISKRLFDARNVDFFVSEDYINEVMDNWGDSVYDYYSTHSLRKALRGEKNEDYIIGMNNKNGELSMYDDEKGAEFKYMFDLDLFYEKIKRLQTAFV